MIKTNKKTKTVSLVLGSGGARGLAHIGVIHWLVQNDYEIKSIAGSSIGALVGGIYAAGKLDIYAKWVMALERKDVIRLLDVSFARKSLFKGDRIIEVLRELIGDYEIKNLPISYTAIATDLNEQREVWINSGPLFDAIRASIAIPTIFTPHKYMGKTFLDGSLVNPIPIAPTLNDSTDFTVVVNLSGINETKTTVDDTKSQDKIINNNHNGYAYHKRIIDFINGLQSNHITSTSKDFTLYEIIAKSMETMQGKIARYQLAAYSPDAVINIPNSVCSFYEFYRARELIDIGYEAANKQLTALR